MSKSLQYGGSIFLRNVAIYLQVHMALQPRKPASATFTAVKTKNLAYFAAYKT
jgi:hypothetical protein